MTPMELVEWAGALSAAVLSAAVVIAFIVVGAATIREDFFK